MRQAGRSGLRAVQYRVRTKYFVQDSKRIRHNGHSVRNDPTPTCSTEPDGNQYYAGEQILQSWWKAAVLCPFVETDSFIIEGLNVREEGVLDYAYFPLVSGARSRACLSF